MKAISIEVVSNLFTTYSHCMRCEVIFREDGLGKRAIQDYPAELKEEIMKLADQIGELRQLYRHRVDIRLTDAQSPRVIYKSLMHSLRPYPAFIVERKDVYIGWDLEKIEAPVDKYLGAAGS